MFQYMSESLSLLQCSVLVTCLLGMFCLLNFVRVPRLRARLHLRLILGLLA